MRCFHPVKAYTHRNNGGVSFKDGDMMKDLTLRCGRCIGCRLTRSKEWQIRCLHEASLYDKSSFVTLTYSEEHYRVDLEYRDFQGFMRRLRKEFRKKGVKKIRFFMSGEYGERGDRPHFHALLFGCHFDDKQIWKRTRGGYHLYRSQTLERLWPFGHSTIGDVTAGTAAYCAKYVVKKIGGWKADVHYLRVNERTGEEVLVQPEFGRMSLRDGIGLGWLERYSKEIYRGDFVVVEGSKVPIPRYYDKRSQKVDEDRFLDTQYDRIKKGLLYDDKDWNRLEILEEVAEAGFKQHKGEL